MGRRWTAIIYSIAVKRDYEKHHDEKEEEEEDEDEIFVGIVVRKSLLFLGVQNSVERIE